ncbi:MAG: glycosyltransferase family 2 protein [Anaerolineaceae bacterium]|jgi:dolichol-phosphate mannosyltransferase
MLNPPSLPRVDIVIPVYNEEKGVAGFHRQLCQAIDCLPYAFTLFYVNDGSGDQTQALLESIAAADRRVVVIELSRNFGHQAALTAGLDQTTGDFVITMDSDGQHPPEMLAQMLDLASSGYDVVLTQRVEEEGLPAFKRWTSNQFYKLLNRIGDTRVTPGAADFRLLARTVVDAVRSMREYHRFLRGMVAWSGFRTVILPFKPPPRLAGESKYSLRKMVRLSMDAIFSFSLLPLYVAISVGVGFLCLALVEIVYVLSFWISGNTARLAPGWSSLMFMLLFVGGSLMIFLGFLGIYVGYIFQEVKRRPIYIIRRRLAAMDPGGDSPQSAVEDADE